MTFSTRVIGVEHVGRELILLSVDTRDTPIAASYERAGQYVTLSTEHSAPGYFSIASQPGEPVLRFLIRHQPHKAKTGPLAELQPGDTVLMSRASGPGYPVFEQEGRDLLMVATGTGIAPLRVVLRQISADRTRFGRISLVYGSVDEESLAFRDEYDDWQGMDVELCLCLSRPRKSWQGFRGYVQDAVPTYLESPERLSVFLCGHPGMVEKVGRCLADHGVSADRIFINH